MVRYYLDENKTSEITLAVDFGHEGDWIEELLFEVTSMTNAILNLSVVQYVPEEKQEEVIDLLKSFLAEDLIATDSDLKGFKDIVFSGQQGGYDLIDTTAIDDLEEGDLQ